MKRFLIVLLSIAFLGFVGLGIFSARSSTIKTNLNEVKIQDDLTQLKALKLEKMRLDSDFDKALRQNNVDAEKIKQLEQERVKSEERTRELEQQVSLKQQREAAIAAVGVTDKVSAASSAWDGVCGDNALAHQIYMQESGCRLNAINSIGCIGIGQNCPQWNESLQRSVPQLELDCPNWRTDYACQNAYFSRYAMAYGSWQQAHDFKFCVGNCYSTRTKITVYKPASNLWW